MPTEAIQHIRRMRGGAQAHLMRCSDGYFYVVKFRNNPQHLRVLANEMFASRLAHLVGLPVPEGEVVEVNDWLIEHTPELSIQLPHSTIRCQAGLQFGSKYVLDPLEGHVIDYLPVEMLGGGAESGNVCGSVSPGQMDGKCGRTPSCLLETQVGEKVHSLFH